MTTPEILEQITTVLYQVFNLRTMFKVTSTVRGKIFYRFATKDNQEIDVSPIDDQLKQMTISVTQYLDEYYDEGLGMMSGGNASTSRITFFKSGSPKPIMC